MADRVKLTEAQVFAIELRKYWSFDDGQMHTHSWHDRENFIERQLPELLSRCTTKPADAPPIDHSTFGRRHSDQTKLKISETRKQQIAAARALAQEKGE